MRAAVLKRYGSLVMREVEKVSARLQKERAAAAVLFTGR